MSVHDDLSGAVELGREVLVHEAQCVQHLADTLDSGPFAQAVQLILTSPGRVIVSGVGKSAHVGRKIAATLASTGTPAFFVHAAEAAHGDLGMITAEDVVVAVSYSGTTNELLTIIPVLKREGIRLISITGNPQSALAKASDVALDIGGDALAVALMHEKGFTKEDFARSHPGGALGRRLLTHVRDIMRSGNDVPSVQEGTSVLDAVREITKKHIGMTAVVNNEGRVTGIFTEGDLRRLIEKRGDIRAIRIDDVMTRTPTTIGPDEMAATAAKILEKTLKNQLLVVDNTGHLIGALHMHDLMSAKVI